MTRKIVKTSPALRVLVGSLGGAVLLALLPTLLAPQAEADDLRRPLVTVYLKNGGHFTLRDTEFLRRQEGERPRGSRPPNAPVGPTPGNTPRPGGFGSPGDDPGGGQWPRGVDPRQPTHDYSGNPRRVGDYLGSGLNTDELRYLRRVDIIRVEKDITYGDFTFKNGETRINVPMMWTAISGWERPGEQGKFLYFDAEDILFLEFPLH
jgi:hypothetical protein